MATVSIKYRGTRTLDDALAGYVVYLRDDATGTYFDFSDGTFKAFGLLVTPTASYTEDAVHSGLWSLDVTTIPLTYTGTLDFLTHQTHNNGGFVDQRSTRIYLGVPLIDLSLSETYLTTNTGGVDNLRVLHESGDPVDGATIRVYNLADYGASPDRWVGVTTTGDDGRWLSIVPVSPGATYVIHVFKTLYYGPTSVEISV